MTQPGLVRISPELVEILRQSTDDARHQIVERACRLAVQRAEVSDPKLDEALEAIRWKSLDSPHLRNQIATLTQIWTRSLGKFKTASNPGVLPRRTIADHLQKRERQRRSALHWTVRWLHRSTRSMRHSTRSITGMTSCVSSASSTIRRKLGRYKVSNVE
jgi:hypothetical protein